MLSLLLLTTLSAPSWDGVATPVAQEPESAAAVPSLLELIPAGALAIAEIDAPRALFDAVLGSGPLRRADEAGLWEQVATLPGVPIVRMVLSGMTRPVEGQLDGLVDALAGGGLLAAVLAPSEGGGQPELVVLARPSDVEIAMECLAGPLALARGGESLPDGDAWTIAIGTGVFERRGDLLLVAGNATALKRVSGGGEGSMAGDAGYAELRRLAPDGSARFWLSGDLLRADGIAEAPDDAFGSLIAGEVHEALRTAPWLGGWFAASPTGLALRVLAPSTDGLAETHAPYLGAPRGIEVPRLPGRFLTATLCRDLGAWYVDRDRYMLPAAFQQTIEGDGNLSLLFGRDLGPDVLAWLEPQALLLAADNPGASGLDPELPAAALGLRLRADAPEDAADAWAHAFLSAMTFTNFTQGSLDRFQWRLDIERIGDGRLYLARLPERPAGAAPDLRDNFSPALYAGDDGTLWLASSDSLLRAVLAAPTESRAAQGVLVEVSLADAMPLVMRNREAILARRLLAYGGDEDRAEQEIARVLAALQLVDRVAMRVGVRDGYVSLDLELHAE